MTEGSKKDTQKELVKEALKEWLNEQFAAFGRWTAKGIAAMLFVVLIYMWFSVHGIDPQKLLTAPEIGIQR